MIRFQYVWVFLGISSLIFTFSGFNIFPTAKSFHHKGAERIFIERHFNNLIPVDSSLMFLTAKFCSGCHGHDNNMHAMVTEGGVDVNIFSAWQATMMANAAKDPFWRAKVSQESLLNPALAHEIQDKCTSCHAPMGHYQATLRGAAHYGMSDLLQDTIGLDGVSCMACHSIDSLNIGFQFSGNINYDTTRIAYGPYDMPFAPPMQDFVGMKPRFSNHIKDPGLCANCHTLQTEAVDFNGMPTGHIFTEQATYHEWLNSNFNTKEHTNGTTCQGCHVPEINEPIIISANYAFLTGHQPYGLHELAGANTFMLQLMKNNKTALGIYASDSSYDQTIKSTMDILQQKSVDFNLSLQSMSTDTAFFDLSIKNKAGHKFPSGYPSRRAFVEFSVVESNGDTLFKSGVLGTDHEIIGHDPVFEPHYDIISKPDQVQIYEMVMGDINMNKTSVLERGYHPLKDNRIPPAGFSTSHYSYDTCLIVGNALTDIDFNKNLGVEGTGLDIIHYHIPISGYSGKVKVYARLFYQTAPPAFMSEMFALSSAAIDTFKSMYNAADQSPLLVATDTLLNIDVNPVGIVELNTEQISIFPNPNHGEFHVKYPSDVVIKEIIINSSDGKEVKRIKDPNDESILLPEENGLYWVQVITEKGKIVLKVLRQL